MATDTIATDTKALKYHLLLLLQPTLNIPPILAGWSLHGDEAAVGARLVSACPCPIPYICKGLATLDQLKAGIFQVVHLCTALKNLGKA